MRAIYHSASTHRRHFALVLMWMLVLPTVSLAGGGTSFQLPQGNKRIKHGIIATVNSRWVDGYGYRPVRVRLSVRKTNRDRTIKVHLYPNSWSNASTPQTITADIEIPQGEKEVTKTLYVPHASYWNWFRADFYEDGEKLKDLSMDNGTNWSSRYYNAGEKPCVLIIDADAPGLDEDRDDAIKKLRSKFRQLKKPSQDLPNIETISFLSISGMNVDAEKPDDEASDVYRDLDSLAILQTATNMELLPPFDIPESSVGLGSIDLVVVSIEELRSLHESDKVRFKTIDDYVRNGGNLIIYGEQGLQSIASELFSQVHEWTASDPSSYYRSANRLSFYQDFEGDGDDRSSLNRKLKAELSNYPGFFVTKHGLGRIVVSDSTDPFVLKSTYWRFMLQTIGSDRMSWIDRHGISLDSDNSDFWDFLIPGYGATPVVSFLSVISLFVICIGPVNFFLLKRAKRFYLLPFTVVLAAIATTSVMMIYAFLSDGVERRVRLRSFTVVEPTTDGRHMAATHCRHAYLAAVAPADGLVFPERTLGYPIDAQAGNKRRRQRMHPTKPLREFHYGYIGSRSTTQFLTTDVQTTDHTIAISSSDEKQIHAVNQLGVAIEHAWLIDADGSVWLANACQADEELKLSLTAPKDARKLFDKIVADHRPKPPEGLEKANSYGLGGMNSARKLAYMETALLHSEMSDCADDILKGKPCTFVAITFLAPPFVQQGLPATQEAGFHMIRGRWQP